MKRMSKFVSLPKIIIFVLLTGFVSSLSHCPSVQAQPAKISQLTAGTQTKRPSFLIAQVTPIQGRWKLHYSVLGIVYESVLTMNGYSGTMRTRYYNALTRRAEAVDQTMKVGASARGLLVVGYTPVYAGTNTRHPTYSPDSFLFQVNPDGSRRSFTCDDRGACSPVEIENF
jgi:hypothetical protein